MLCSAYPNFPGTGHTIEGKSYTAQELKDNVSKFSVAKAKKNLIKLVAECEKFEEQFQSDKRLVFDNRNDRAVCIKDEKTGQDVLAVGNALMIALVIGEYDILNRLIGRVRLEDGKIYSFCNNPFNSGVGVEINGVHILELLLTPEKLPEDLQLRLLEVLAEQNNEISLEEAEIKWPMMGPNGYLTWENRLLELKKYPSLYDKLMTEKFICEYLLYIAGWYNACAKKDRAEIVKNLKLIAGNLSDLEAMWSVVKQRKLFEFNPGYGIDWNNVRNYMKLWKLVTGQPICLSAKDDPYWSECTDEGADICNMFSYTNFITTVLEMADYIVGADSLNERKLFEYFFREGKEAELLAALKKNLLTVNMLPSAMKYMEEKNQLWAFPFLVMKQHGEFIPEGQNENR